MKNAYCKGRLKMAAWSIGSAAVPSVFAIGKMRSQPMPDSIDDNPRLEFHVK
jgi:hypothetical protein